MVTNEKPVDEDQWSESEAELGEKVTGTADQGFILCPSSNAIYTEPNSVSPGEIERKLTAATAVSGFQREPVGHEDPQHASQ